ncbi:MULTISPECIES: prophage tail fiber N-terminal domain-containing protein [unclassified Serratia (in: enterobacteria)]|uniref:phage tail fiber protein n=1 Tax=unclassified Serratia (in: enterobacteria) TaxID=2647522 RepID=UPI000468319C|nr:MULTISPECIES: prophage tail fiber N-terminal domain-containing protein [unclassified Serratia (in: enterobacteria)]
MAVISGVLKGPMGDARVGVVIELHAVRTSATVVIQARSQSVTDATGRYTLSVEPGQYDVMITAAGRQPERVGGIQVMLNSATGTLNDFLTIPGETDLNPEIVATVDRMRADAAASAAAAKASETNATAVTGVLNSSPGGATAEIVWRRIGKITNFGQGGKTLVITIGGTAQYNGRTSTNGLTQIVIRSGSGGVTTINTSGRASISAYVTNGAGTANSSQLINDLGLIEVSANTYEVYLRYNPFIGDISASIDGVSMSDLINNWKWERTIVDSPTIVLDREIIKVWTEGNLPTPLKPGDYGLGSATPVTYTDANTLGINQFIRLAPGTPNMPTPTTAAWAGISWGYDGGSRAQLLSQQGQNLNNLVFRVSAPGAVWSNWATLWHSTNTTVDANGFVKKASPIVKLFGTGESELNDQSQGVTTERVSEGVYRISGTLGFNADAEWGGVDGGIEIPTDRNKLPLVWVDYEVDETGDLLIKTFHRVNSTAPKFAQNVKTGYKEGQPIDIPVGRWIDLRVEMPGSDEPEYVPEPETEEDVILEPGQPDVTEPESGEESAPGETEPTEEPRE